ncbi:cell wall-binding repeat-containing protein [Herbiconiux sp. CPCC 203407]|uniref:Cell wall-binding repeat-containing protein n=1 Tax=Herbiconiux oxytropis TaxID=2970915 RepID=A0AA42BSK6_9MICO|nr:cell wall-binding repeat-containing protein [Herbiconiux oxytropis]MCS5722693.1 cell wall-binding repeat-containing protein [Herbiconiux oxytropis]MCS5725390.1 cell wall-binding repeat-containing protein [Herbiconiux oxytropis]
MHSSPSRGRAAAALATGLTAAVAFSALTALPASATTAPAETEPLAAVGIVKDAVFQWGVSNEVGNRAFAPGTFNLLGAGKIAKTSAADTIVQADWKATDGNVVIQKQQADGSYATSTWGGLTTDATGTPITSPTGGRYSANRVTIAAGTGTVDAENDSAEISWDGDFTVALYSGMTQFYVSDPVLEVANGSGSVTATVSGFGSDMNDPTLYVPLPDTVVTIADLQSVDVTESGFVVTPDYLGVEIDAPEGGTPQVRTGLVAGAFPQSFVDFQGLTGQSSYWYSSGGSTDVAKPALPLSATYSAPVATPVVSVSKTEGLNPDTDVVTVTGTGFSPNAPATSGTRPPLAGKFGGAYVAFGSFADVWKPSEGAPRASRTTADTKWILEAADVATVGGAAAGAVAIDADGSFQVDITVEKDFEGALADGNYGIYTYPGSGAVYAPFETYTPISFGAAVPTRIEGADRYDVAVKIAQKSHPTTSDVVYLANGSTFTDALSAAPAAAGDSAPLLLTTSDRLLPVVKAELERLKPKTVVVVGGPKSIQPAVFDQIDAIATDEAVRIDGADRYAVSQSVADYAFGGGATTAYVATGTNFPDALSASAAAGSNGYPVVLVYGKAGTADAATKALLTDLGVKKVKIAGGPASVSAGIATSLASVAPVTRLSGADRYQASIAINRDAFTAADDVFIATGLKFPDALAGAVLAASKDAPLYVVPAGCVPTGVIQDIGTFAPDRVTLLGGTASLSPAVQSLTACAF